MQLMNVLKVQQQMFLIKLLIYNSVVIQKIEKGANILVYCFLNVLIYLTILIKLLMSYKQKKQRRNNLIFQQEIFPIIGLLDQAVTLRCQINTQFQTHRFVSSFSHPLQCITRIIQKRRKEVFEKILLYSDLHRINLQNVFLPKQLLKGNSSVMSTFKRQLQKTKINSYIKLNIIDQKVDFSQKRSNSCELTTENFNSKSSKLQSKSIQKRYDQSNQNFFNSKGQEVSVKNCQKENKCNASSRQQINLETHYTSKTIVNQKKKSKSKPLNLNVSYTIIQNNLDNPQSSSFYEKAFTSRDNNYKAQKNKHEKYEQSLKVPSLNNYQSGRAQGHLIATYHDQILSERMNRSVKNSQASELTHQQHQVFYFSKQQKYSKKEKRVFEVEENC